MISEVKTCEVCGWRGEILRHNPNSCARYVQMKKMYLGGISSRAIGRVFSTSNKTVLHALKAMGVERRRPGGLNNPLGVNGRVP